MYLGYRPEGDTHIAFRKRTIERRNMNTREPVQLSPHRRRLPAWKALLTAGLILNLGNACADGLKLKNGRYDGAVVVLTLSKSQQADVDRFRTCMRKDINMNRYTPYVFQLSSPQLQVVVNKTGLRPGKFEVFQTFRGDDDAGPFWNVALQFNPGKLEIPIELVVSAKDAQESEKMQGWELANPCAASL